MHRRERSIRERFEQQPCSHCGSPYPTDGVVVVAHRGSVYVLLATCAHCQHRAFFLVSFPPRSPEPTSSTPTPVTTGPHSAVSPTMTLPGRSAVTNADVEQMRRFLEGFDGDFSSLFGE
jgi:hypothetical protein